MLMQNGSSIERSPSLSDSDGPISKPNMYPWCFRMAGENVTSHIYCMLGYMSVGIRKMHHQKANGPRNAKQTVYFSFMSTLLMILGSSYTDWFPTLLCKSCNIVNVVFFLTDMKPFWQKIILYTVGKLERCFVDKMCSRPFSSLFKGGCLTFRR